MREEPSARTGKCSRAACRLHPQLMERIHPRVRFQQARYLNWPPKRRNDRVNRSLLGTQEREREIFSSVTSSPTPLAPGGPAETEMHVDG